MPRSSSTCRKFLEMHGGKWRVTVAVPADLRKALGTRLKHALKTDSLAVANALKHRVVADLRERIEAARDGAAGRPRAVIQEAIAVRGFYRAATDDEEFSDIDRMMLQREEELLGPPLRELNDPETGEPIPVYDPKRQQLAADFRSVAAGKGTPLGLHRDEYLGKITVAVRTKADDERAIAYLARWCQDQRIPAMVEAITPKLATRFLDALPALAGGIAPATVKKYRNRLAVYWAYMIARHDIPGNPWAATRVHIPRTTDAKEERPFTDEEVRKLLTGPGPQKMLDLMRVAALTGARIEVIVDLKVRDWLGDSVHFKAAKQERKGRDVPAHPDLIEIFERRCLGKIPEDDVFPEWPKPRAPGSKRERSFKASNAFTEYRRNCGVDERIDGRRRSLVNFHSWRRWFTTKAERAGAPGTIVSSIIGHQRGSITLDRYSAGPAWGQARDVIVQVNLPPLDQGPIEEARPLSR